MVGAWDGQFGNDTNVNITILNVNDMRPQFLEKKYTVELMEESVPTYPITQVKAVDPDIGNDYIDQNITYHLDSNSEVAKHFRVDPKDGKISVIKKLDRDLPNGYPVWQMFIFAKDNNGLPGSLENYVEFEAKLNDINDNPPFLDMPNGLVWTENQKSGPVGMLVANDYDEEQNGPPFTFSIDRDARPDIKDRFRVERTNNGYQLVALTTFDREKQKQHFVPIRICDREDMCATSLLKLIIGDVNDNPMSPGSSEIFVYHYENHSPDTQIGRVYVNDPDDWDLPDKTFKFRQPSKWRNKFELNSNTGMITMKRGIALPQEINTFELEFVVGST